MSRFFCAALFLGAVSFAGAGVLLDSHDVRADGAPVPDDKKTRVKTSEADLTNSIDAEIAKVYEREKIKPAKQADDEEFVRRVYLDTVGVPPSYDEAVAFLDDRNKNKRDELIDQLIEDPRFGRNMADHWALQLTPRRADVLSGGHLFAKWLADEINAGTGFNTVIREIVTAEGELVDNAAIVPYFAGGEGVRFTDMVGKISKGLTGVQIQCAECHDHPYDEDLTQKSFQGMASFLTATAPRIDNNTRPQRVSVRTDASGPKKILEAFKQYDKLNAAQKARVDQYIDFVRPVTLDGIKIDTRDPAIWRDSLAAWITHDENEQTRRYVANRMWSIAFGTGIVNPVNDFNDFNEASHPELLELLAEDLLASDWDIRRLYRVILKSDTYQLSSKDAPKKTEAWHFASYSVRPLNAEQFLGTLIRLLDDDQVEEIVQANRGGGITKAISDLEAAIKRQEESKDPNLRRYEYDIPTLRRYGEQFEEMDGRWFLARWAAGRYSELAGNNEEDADETFTMSIDQALAVMNGSFTNALAGTGEGSLLRKVGERFDSMEERIEAISLMLLSRRPTKTELRTIAKHFKEAEDEGAAAEDLMFALLMTTEFATNH